MGLPCQGRVQDEGTCTCCLQTSYISMNTYTGVSYVCLCVCQCVSVSVCVTVSVCMCMCVFSHIYVYLC